MNRQIAKALFLSTALAFAGASTTTLVPTTAIAQETQMVAELIEQLKAQGIGIFLIEHDVHSVMNLCDRASVMKNGQLVGTVDVNAVTDEDILSMIILGKQPTTTAA